MDISILVSALLPYSSPVQFFSYRSAPKANLCLKYKEWFSSFVKNLRSFRSVVQVSLLVSLHVCLNASLWRTPSDMAKEKKCGKCNENWTFTMQQTVPISWCGVWWDIALQFRFSAKEHQELECPKPILKENINETIKAERKPTLWILSSTLSGEHNPNSAPCSALDSG